MLDVYLTRFEVKGRTKKRLISDIRRSVADELGLHSDDLAVDGEHESDHGVKARWLVEGSADEPSAFDLALSRPSNEGLVVVDRIEVNSGKRPQMRAVVSVSPQESGPRPFYGGLYPPDIVVDLVAERHATDGPHPLTCEPRVVTPDDVDSLVSFLESGRRLPVVCFSEGPQDMSGLDARRAAKLFAGAAHPIMLTHEAALKLTQLKGKAWSTFNGAVRVYLPGVDWNGSARTHPLWITDRHPEPDTIQDAARRVCVDEARWNGLDEWSIPRMRLERARSQAGSDQGDWMSLLEELEDERDELRLEVTSLEKKLAAVAAGSNGHAYDPPSSVADALNRVTQRDTPGVIWLESAKHSANASPYRRPERALEVLEAVAALGEVYHCGALHQEFEAFLGERGVKLGYVSSNIRSRWPRDYQRSYDGTRVELSDHAKVGSGSSENLFRVYWHRDETNRRLVVGHIGSHLTNLHS